MQNDIYSSSELEQRSLDWFRSRLGVITGSKVGCLMGKGRSDDQEFSQTAMKYIYQLASERSFSKTILNNDDMFLYYIDSVTSSSKAMRFGIEQEDEARRLYSMITRQEVSETGLVHHPKIPYFASSPDGVILDSESGRIAGCMEIKCPSLTMFASYVNNVHDGKTLKKINPEYFYQTQSHIMCTEAPWCDFVVYCPFIENPMRIIKIYPDYEAQGLLINRAARADKLITEIAEVLQTEDNGYMQNRPE